MRFVVGTFRIPPLARLVFSHFLFSPFAVFLFDFSLVPVVFAAFSSSHYLLARKIYVTDLGDFPEICDIQILAVYTPILASASANVPATNHANEDISSGNMTKALRTARSD